MDITWENLRTGCITLLRPKTCDVQDDQDGQEVIGEGTEGEGEAVEEEASGGGEIVTEGDGLDDSITTAEGRRRGRRLRGGQGSLRRLQKSSFRAFTTIDLNGFTLLATGLTSSQTFTTSKYLHQNLTQIILENCVGNASS